MQKNILNKLMWAGAVISVVLAVLCFVFAMNTEKTFTSVILITVAVLFVVLAAMVGYLAYIDTFKVIPGAKADKKPLNYFLNYNGKKKGIAIVCTK